MHDIAFNAPLVGFLITALALVLYAILDGFDLGIGILFALRRKDEERDKMMNAIAPVWDGNETWMIFGGVALLALFPQAYALVLETYYLPIMIMLFALVFRGVAFEFRFKAVRSKRAWGLAFYLGSIIASLSQGLILGHVVQSFNGLGLPLISPFTVVASLTLTLAYGLLGLLWLNRKLPQWHWPRTWAMVAALALALMVLLLCYLSVTTIAAIGELWQAQSWLWGIPLMACVLTACMLLFLYQRSARRAFGCMMALALVMGLGLLASVFPYLVPGHLTYMQAAVSEQSFIFALLGMVVLLPVILGYTLWGYKIFSGELNDHGYH